MTSTLRGVSNKHCLLPLFSFELCRKETRSDTNWGYWAVQPHEMARSLKLWIQEVEGLYYLCSENKGTSQLCDYRTADLRLCFPICKSGFLIRPLKFCTRDIYVNTPMQCTVICTAVKMTVFTSKIVIVFLFFLKI